MSDFDDVDGIDVKVREFVTPGPHASIKLRGGFDWREVIRVDQVLVGNQWRTTTETRGDLRENAYTSWTNAADAVLALIEHMDRIEAGLPSEPFQRYHETRTTSAPRQLSLNFEGIPHPKKQENDE